MLKIILTLFALIFFSRNIAYASGILDYKSIKLSGEEKQNYMKNRLEVIYKKKSGEPHKFEIFKVPEGWKYKKIEVEGVKYEILENPAAKTDRVLLNIHGGGYILPLDDGYRNFAMIQGILSDAKKIYIADYRIAPENKFPVANEDCIKIYEEILKLGTKPEKIIIAGDSVGATLAIELCLHLQEKNLKQPRCLILISPNTTAENKLPSRKYNLERDLILGKNSPLYESMIKNPYTEGTDKKNPKISPLYAEIKNFPATLIQVGSYEIFFDECIEFAKKLAMNNIKISLTVYPEMPHDFSLMFPELEESVETFIEIKNFAEKNFNPE